MMVSFIDEYRRVYGVEPICAVLPIAPSTYYAYLRQRRDPASRAARLRGAGLVRPYAGRALGIAARSGR